MTDLHQYARVEFSRFKAFKTFSLELRHFNILVGPNNAGKSTILAAFRILAAAMRKAAAKKAALVQGPQGAALGHDIDLSQISVAEENLFFNYDSSEPAQVKFTLSNRNTLTLYFPDQGSCMPLSDAEGKHVSTPSNFKAHFNCPIGFVPILGPVEHHEPLYEKEAARLALFNYRAARNFRNIWYHYQERFDEFRSAILETWPGMDIERPQIDISHGKARLYMFCPEERIPRELFWSGFGFQVWCQMLTYLIQSKEVSLFLIDEPDIYLHSELQRQLLVLLRNLGPDILLATHSTEIITEAETDEIILINKTKRSARRIKSPSEIEEVFNSLGSNMNPILTQLAKTRRALFVEGKDFQVIGKFARKLGAIALGNRTDFAVISVEGFNPERVRNLKAGMEVTLGVKIVSCVILDRDYRCDDECAAISLECKKYCDFVIVHKCKEVENFLLVPDAIDRAAAQRIADRARRLGEPAAYEASALDMLERFASEKKSYVASQLITYRRQFERARRLGLHDATLVEMALATFEKQWAEPATRLTMIPGKDAISSINKQLRDKYGINVTESAIIDVMRPTEIPAEMKALIQMLSEFSAKRPSM